MFNMNHKKHIAHIHKDIYILVTRICLPPESDGQPTGS